MREENKITLAHHLLELTHTPSDVVVHVNNPQKHQRLSRFTRWLVVICFLIGTAIFFQLDLMHLTRLYENISIEYQFPDNNPIHVDWSNTSQLFNGYCNQKRPLADNLINLLPCIYEKFSKTSIFSEYDEFVINIGAGDSMTAQGKHEDELNLLIELFFNSNETENEIKGGIFIDPIPQHMNDLKNLWDKRFAVKTKNYVYISDSVKKPQSFVQDVLIPNNCPKKFMVFKIDTDSFDCDMIENLLANGYRPAIIQMEINMLYPPPIAYCFHYSNALFNTPNYNWPWNLGKYLDECSLQYVVDMFERVTQSEYKIFHLNYYNLILIHRVIVPQISTMQIWKKGWYDERDKFYKHFWWGKENQINYYDKWANIALDWCYDNKSDAILQDLQSSIFDYTTNLKKQSSKDISLFIGGGTKSDVC